MFKYLPFGFLFCLAPIMAGLFLIGCNSPVLDGTPFVLVPTIAEAATLPPPPTILESDLPPTNTAAPSATSVPTSTPTPLPSETPVVQFASTDTPTATSLPKLLPTSTSTPITPLESGLPFAGELGPDEFRIHLVDTLEGRTVYSMLRLKPELDGRIAAYQGSLPEIASDEGISVQDVLISEFPEREADFNGEGLPELIAFRPQTDEAYTLLVTAEGTTEGTFPYRLYTFDLETASPHVVNGSTITLPAGGTQSFQVSSNGGKPVAVFARPATTGGNVKVAINGANGSIIEADFGGPNSFESAYVLPVRTTSYSIDITNVGGSDGSFEILIVALQDGF